MTHYLRQQMISAIILFCLCLSTSIVTANQAASEMENRITTVLPVAGSAKKLQQLVGDFDRERNQSTAVQTGRLYGVTGTDLGVSFEHQDKLYLLFGNTIARRGCLSGLAYTTDKDPENGIKLTFVTDPDGKSLPFQIQGAGQERFVPVEGLSVNGQIYVYFTACYSDPKGKAKSIVAKYDETSRSFKHLYDLSTKRFINVQVAVVDIADLESLPKDEGKGLLLWGSGDYRESSPYLAFMPLAYVEDLRGTLRYFVGVNNQTGRTIWSTQEEQANPLFNDPCIGELSVSWNRFLGRWIMMYNGKNPEGINLRSSRCPWGPWSESSIVFDPWRDGGYGHFIHVSWQSERVDNVSDPGRENESGEAYGPYVISPFTKGDAGRSTIYFTISTLNPYTVVLMKAELELLKASSTVTAITSASQICAPSVDFQAVAAMIAVVLLIPTLIMLKRSRFRKKDSTTALRC